MVLPFTTSITFEISIGASFSPAPDAPQDEDDLLTAAVNRAILEGFSPLFAQLMKENDLQPVTEYSENVVVNLKKMIEFLRFPVIFYYKIWVKGEGW